MDGSPMLPSDRGAYRLEGRAEDGRVLFSHAFEPSEVDHAPNVRQFLFAIPVSEPLQESLSELAIRGPGGTAALTRSPNAPAPAAGARGGAMVPSMAVQRGGPGAVNLACVDPGMRGIVVLDAATGGVLGTASGPALRLSVSAGTGLTVLCTDGIRTSRRSVTAP
jgi:hypothetical protein